MTNRNIFSTENFDEVRNIFFVFFLFLSCFVFLLFFSCFVFRILLIPSAIKRSLNARLHSPFPNSAPVRHSIRSWVADATPYLASPGRKTKGVPDLLMRERREKRRGREERGERREERGEKRYIPSSTWVRHVIALSQEFQGHQVG